MNSFLAFLGVAAIVIVAPGPDTAVTIRNTLLGGVIGGLATAVGIVLGQTIWALSTSFGIVALLVASAPLFLTVRYLGAAYLVYLGLRALREALSRRAEGPVAAPGVPPPQRLPTVAAFRQGLLSDLGNPKMAMFFASLLPQFVPAGEASFSALMLRGLVFAAMTLSWLFLYSLLVAKLGDFLHRRGVRRMMEALTGVVLIGLGLRIATEQR